MFSRTKLRLWTGIVACLAVATFINSRAAAEVVEEIIAQVNEHPIILSDYKRSLQTLRQDLQQESRGSLDLEGKFNERSKDVLRDLIDQQLLVQQASELSINADSDVIKRMDAIRVQMKLPTMEALESAVAQQGMSYEDFKQNMRDGILTQQVIGREVGSRVQVSPQEISAYYEKHKEELTRSEGVHIQQILILADGKPESDIPAAQKKADDALAKVRGGADFAAVAREFSEDASAASGGDAGFFERGNMAPELETIAYAMKKNQISDVIRTKYGFLILKLLDHTQPGIPSLAEAETTIHEKIYYDKMQPSLREYLTRLRQQSHVVIKAGYTDTGAAPAEQAASEKQPDADTAKR